MDKKNWLFILAFAVLLLPGCVIDLDDDDGFNNCISGRGGTITADLDLNNFEGIKLKVDAVVFIAQGNNQSVVIEAEENIINEIELDVQNDIWDIEFNDCVNNHDDIRIFITMPYIRFLAVSGSGVIRSENIFDLGNLDWRVSGSGYIDWALNAQNIDSRISGSGKVFLEGNTEEFDFQISGSGDYRAFNLNAIEGDIRVSGSGDAEVRVADFLDVEINGSGDVFYKGFPALNVDISGSGSVIDAN